MKSIYLWTFVVLANLCSLVVFNSGWASSLMRIDGKLVSFNDNQCVVETPQFTYYISKKHMLKKQIEELDRTEVPVSITVPMEGIIQVKSHFNDKKK